MTNEIVSVCIFLWFAVWQYLRNAELHKVVDNSNNPWHKLVAGSEHLQGAMILCVFLSVHMAVHCHVDTSLCRLPSLRRLPNRSWHHCLGCPRIKWTWDILCT